jgi:hypothetical protein
MDKYIVIYVPDNIVVGETTSLEDVEEIVMSDMGEQEMEAEASDYDVYAQVFNCSNKFDLNPVENRREES